MAEKTGGQKIWKNFGPNMAEKSQKPAAKKGNFGPGFNNK